MIYMTSTTTTKGRVLLKQGDRIFAPASVFGEPTRGEIPVLIRAIFHSSAAYHLSSIWRCPSNELVNHLDMGYGSLVYSATLGKWGLLKRASYALAPEPEKSPVYELLNLSRPDTFNGISIG